MTIFDLHDAVAAVAPIQGVSMGTEEDPSTWSIQFTDSATPEERDAGQSALTDFAAQSQS